MECSSRVNCRASHKILSPVWANSFRTLGPSRTAFSVVTPVTCHHVTSCHNLVTVSSNGGLPLEPMAISTEIPLPFLDSCNSHHSQPPLPRNHEPRRSLRPKPTSTISISNPSY